MPRGMKVNSRSDNEEEGESMRVREDAWQMWHLNGTRCPKGTVPIRRSTVHDVVRAKSLYDYGKKRSQLPLSRRNDAPDVLSANGHEVPPSLSSNIYTFNTISYVIEVWYPVHVPRFYY